MLWIRRGRVDDAYHRVGRCRMSEELADDGKTLGYQKTAAGDTVSYKSWMRTPLNSAAARTRRQGS